MRNHETQPTQTQPKKKIKTKNVGTLNGRLIFVFFSLSIFCSLSRSLTGLLQSIDFGGVDEDKKPLPKSSKLVYLPLAD